MNQELYSFDVFDTLITRMTATPSGIFALIQKELLVYGAYDFLNQHVKKNFASIRIQAERVARNTYAINEVEDVTLEQIYEAILMGCDVSDQEKQILCELERKVEINAVCGIRINVNKVKKLVSEGKRVILISDMYLDIFTIRKLLHSVDSIFDNIPIYLSSEMKKGKWTGNLFKEIQKLENVNYESWFHYGDNGKSDYEIPKKLGINCEIFDYEGLLVVEQNLISDFNLSSLVDPEIQLAIGCARNIRLFEKTPSTATRIGCSIGPIILYPYVEWLLKESIKRGFKRLYFIARDSYILKTIADQIVLEFNYEIETYYIYGSRAAWRIPALACGDLKLFDVYRRSYEGRIQTVYDMAEFLQVPVNDFIEYLPGGQSYFNKYLNKTEVDKIMECLSTNPDFLLFLNSRYQDKKKILSEYLRQEVDDTDDNFAFVDLAGTGFTQGCLARVMNEYFPGTVTTFFYRMDNMHMADNCKNIVFYPNFISHFVMLEMLCRAPHGQTIGYEKNGEGRVIPVFSNVDTQAIIEHGVIEYIEGARKFAREFAKVLHGKGYSFDNLEMINAYMHYIIETPDKELMNFFGDMPNMLTGRERKSEVYAPVLTKKELKNIFLLREKQSLELYYKGSDFEYSLLRLDQKKKNKMEFYKKNHKSIYGKISRSIHYMYKSVFGGKIEYVLPYDLIDKNIIVYAAGKRGRLLYEQMMQSDRHNVVLWIDKNYEDHQKQGLDVHSIEELGDFDYEQIVIGVMHENVAKQIKQELIDIGIAEHKILWIIPSAKYIVK